VEMKKLTDIVWPEIARLAQNKIAAFVENGAKIVVVDAAVLIEAGWDSMCHEVWVSFVPRDVVSAQHPNASFDISVFTKCLLYVDVGRQFPESRSEIILRQKRQRSE